MNCKVFKKYWQRKELQGLEQTRLFKIIELLEIWEGNVNDLTY